MGYNILIADDIAVNSHLMVTILKKALVNAVYFIAEDGNQTLHCIDNQEIDLVILDLMMPGKDGFEVLREIKGQDQYKEIPVIVNSALEKMESVKKALELGATDYFVKPLTDDQIQVILPLKVQNALKYYEQTKRLKQLNRQMKNEFSIARILQQKLMADYRQFPQAEVYGCYIPWNEIGGDFYDSIQLDEDLWFIMADVMGHGVASAMVSSMLKVVFGESIRKYHFPDQVLAYLNDTFNSLTKENNIFVFSAFVGLISRHKLFFSNAGHPYPLILRRTRHEVEYLEENGFLIGAFDGTSYACKQIDLEPGDAVLTYTDGLLIKKSIDSQARWGLDHDFLYGNLDLIEKDPSSYIGAIIQNISQSQEDGFSDDAAVMLIKTKRCL
jgi:sigma-B regulation protein RsbU (phosphoserine phosphatase)